MTSFYPESKKRNAQAGVVLPPAAPRRASGSPVSGGQAVRPTPALGTYAKSIDPPPLGAPFPVPAGVDTPALLRGLRADRYRLLGAARGLLVAAGARAGLEHPHNYARTAKCCYICHQQGGVHVLLAPELVRAFYGGLVSCGSVWACPVCAAKVQERRREEIAQAIDWAYTEGLQPVLVTLTFPHRAWHKLGDLLKQQARALQLLRMGKPWAKFRAKYDYNGLIRALELMHGRHGWHPHTHELWFVKRDSADAPNSVAAEMQTQILKMWESACRRAGLLVDEKIDAFRAHAVDVKGNCSASDYMAKQDDQKHWGVDREIAKASTKAGRAKGVHPFGLLAKSADGDVRAGRLFLAYTIAMKGKRQIFWSPGLKDRVRINDVDDETLAAEQREEVDILGTIEQSDWRTIREAGARAQVLDAAELGGWPAVESLIDILTLAEIERMQAAIDALSVSPAPAP